MSDVLGSGVVRFERRDNEAFERLACASCDAMLPVNAWWSRAKRPFCVRCATALASRSTGPDETEMETEPPCPFCGRGGVRFTFGERPGWGWCCEAARHMAFDSPVPVSVEPEPVAGDGVATPDGWRRTGHEPVVVDFYALTQAMRTINIAEQSGVLEGEVEEAWRAVRSLLAHIPNATRYLSVGSIVKVGRPEPVGVEDTTVGPDVEEGD